MRRRNAAWMVGLTVAGAIGVAALDVAGASAGWRAPWAVLAAGVGVWWLRRRRRAVPAVLAGPR